MPKMICICIFLIYFKVISKKGGHYSIAPAYPIMVNTTQNPNPKGRRRHEAVI